MCTCTRLCIKHFTAVALVCFLQILSEKNASTYILMLACYLAIFYAYIATSISFGILYIMLIIFTCGAYALLQENLSQCIISRLHLLLMYYIHGLGCKIAFCWCLIYGLSYIFVSIAIIGGYVLMQVVVLLKRGSFKGFGYAVAAGITGIVGLMFPN